MSEEAVIEVEDDWLLALLAAESSLHHLRRIYPDKMMLLTETGHQAIRSAMGDVQSGLASIHRAGRHVMGVDRYESFLRERVYEYDRPTREEPW